MAFKHIWIAFIFVIHFVSCFTIQSNIRHDELRKMQRYELVYFNLDSFEAFNIITFFAFDEYYEVKLTLNEDLNPSLLKHTNNLLSHRYNLEQFWSNLTSSCHYFAKVINIDSSSSGSLSLCDKQGIRGRIHIFGDLLEIKPAKYYFDLQYDRFNSHHLTDQHLIYKYSEFNDTIFPLKHHHRHNILPPFTSLHPSTKRRLSDDSDSINLIETFTFVTPNITDEYKSLYTNSWEDKLLSDLADCWNAVADQYYNPQFCQDEGKICSSSAWGPAINRINIKWIEVEIAEYWHDYKDLIPRKLVVPSWGNQQLYDADELLTKFQAYIQRKFGTNPHFDHSLLTAIGPLTDPEQVPIGGLAPCCSMCDGGHKAVQTTVHYRNPTHLMMTVAHELGHNLGFLHDGYDNECSDKDGLMGYGGAQSGWSYCTRNDMQAFFNNRNPNCFEDQHEINEFMKGTNGRNIIIINERNNTNISNTTTTTSTLAAEPNECVTIHDMKSYSYKSITIDFNGAWFTTGAQYKNHSIYKLSASVFYLFHNKQRKWVISKANAPIGDDLSDIVAVCNKQTLSDCKSGKWRLSSSASNMSVSIGCNHTETESECDALQCISFENLNADAEGVNYGDFVWIPAGCHESYAYYKSTINDRYLCYYQNRKTYVIADKLCGGNLYAYGGRDSTDILSYIYWKVWKIAPPSAKHARFFSKDRDVCVSECDMNGFTDHASKFTDCLVEEYDVCLEIYNDGRGKQLWNGTAQFTAFGSFCMNDKPIYSYIVNDSKHDEIVYYLRYQQQSEEWVVSVDDRIYDAYIYAKCKKVDLRECVDGNWEVLVRNVDYYAFETNVWMTIMKVDQCVDKRKEDIKTANNYKALWIIITCIVLVFVLVLICSYRMNVNTFDKEEIPSDEDQDMEEEVVIRCYNATEEIITV